MPVNWVDGITPVNAANLETMEADTAEIRAQYGLDALTLGGDVSLYRSAANELRTDDSLVVAGPSLVAGAGLFETVYGRTYIRKGGPDQIYLGDQGAGGSIPVIEFGSAGDTNLYRSAANVLKTDDTLLVGKATVAAYTTGIEFNPLGLIYATRSAVAADVFRAAVNADTVPRLNIDSDGKHSWGPGNAVADTNLYRQGANILQTDDSLRIRRSGAVGTEVAFGVYAAAESFMRVQINNDGTFIFGDGTAGGETNLYRKAANILGTDDGFRGGQDLMANTTPTGGFTANTVAIGHTGGGLGPMIVFGLGADTNLYRAGAQLLKTDSTLHVAAPIHAAGNIYAKLALTDAEAQIALLRNGDGTPGIYFGPGGASAMDTNLYRSAAGQLTTDGMLLAKGLLRAQHGNPAQITFSEDATTPKILFGSADDTNLYRASANVLKTDHQFQAVGMLYASWNGAAYGFHVGQPNANGITLGGDTNLYRYAANRLKTDDTFVVGWNEGTTVDTGLFVNVNGVERRVVVGAADSAGAGYKMLRILN